VKFVVRMVLYMHTTKLAGIYKWGPCVRRDHFRSITRKLFQDISQPLGTHIKQEA